MRFSRRTHLSDEAIEQILSARQAPEPPSEATAAAHLSAIIAESRRVREEHAAQPALGRRTSALPGRMAASAVALTAFISLAIAGALPGPVQAAASDVLAVVGISIPGGADERGEPGRNPEQRPDKPGAGPSDAARPSSEEDREQSRQVPAAPEVRADDDGDRSGSDHSGDEPKGSDRERDRADDDDRRGSDEGSRDEESRDEGSRDDDSRRESDEDSDDGEPSRSGSDSDDDEPEDSSETDEDEGAADDHEGPGAETRSTDDEPDESGDDTEDRSGTGGDAPSDSGDEPETAEN